MTVYGYARQGEDRWILGVTLDAPNFEVHPATHKLVSTSGHAIAACLRASDSTDGFLYTRDQFSMANMNFDQWNKNPMRVCNHCFERSKKSLIDYWNTLEESYHGHPIYVLSFLEAVPL